MSQQAEPLIVQNRTLAPIVAKTSVETVTPEAPEREPWYFEKYEGRKPPEPVPASKLRDFAYQAFAVAALALGVRYLIWRYTASINWHAWWFSIPLLIAETLAFGGSILFFLSVWRNGDTAKQAPPVTLNDTLAEAEPTDRKIIVDVFFPTYNEDVELVRLSIRDAKRMRYPHAIDVRVHVLDDGKRVAMKQVAAEEGCNYFTRSSNEGYKAGNLRNGMEHTQGDFLVICDADTRVFPELLEQTLGYFRDPKVAWVQTPQWFFDLDEGERLSGWLGRKLGKVGGAIGRGIERVIGPVRLGEDPLGNDPEMFYDVIQRRRNWCNGSFCCGAGSIHRREAVMEAALKGFGDQIERAIRPTTKQVKDDELRHELTTAMAAEAAREIDFTPYKFHVSEDIYTSIVLHSDPERQWRSVYHPAVLTKMLSPQDLLTWSIQRFKYAGGTLDIFKNDNPLTRRGLSAWQRLTYGATIYSYLAPLWTVIFLLAPIVYFFSGVAPMKAYDADFYSHLLPFLVVNKVAFMLATWGTSALRGEQYYLAFFWLNIKALRDVLLGRPVKFHVTPKTKQAGNYYSLVYPHIAILSLFAIGAAVMAARILLLHQGNMAAFVANVFWCAYNAYSLSTIIRAAGRKEAA
ncbi:hypothetical protein BH09MYX1_BH09MYX1_35490 [soil metagenome]